MRGFIVTFEQLDPYADMEPLVDAIKKHKCLQVSMWAWVVSDSNSSEELLEELKPIATPNFRLFIAEFINPKTLNPICGAWAFTSNG